MYRRVSGQAFLALFGLALLMRLGLAVAWYTDDLRNFQSGDYGLYYIGGEHIRTEGDFTNSLFLVRPPLFPLLIHLLNLNSVAVLLVNSGLGALLSPLSYVFARQLGLRQPFAFLAGVIVAFDPASVVYSTFLGAEPLANLLLLLAVIVLQGGLQAPAGARAWFCGALAGSALALSALARPATYMLWVVLSVGLLLVDRRKWRLVAALAAVCCTSTILWTVHNGVVFGNYTFSTIGVYNLLYYRAASVERLATGKAIDVVYRDLSERVEASLGHDTADVDSHTRYHHYAPQSELQAVMTRVAIDVFLSDPLAYIATIPLGVVRMFGRTTPLPGWSTPLEVAWNVILVGGTAMGLQLAFRRGERFLFGVVLIVTAYYTLGTLLVQVSGMDTRMRTMMTPLMASAVAYGASVLWTDRPARRGLAEGTEP